MKSVVCSIGSHCTFHQHESSGGGFNGRLTLINALSFDSWAEIMSKLAYPSISDAYSSCKDIVIQYDKESVWKTITLLKHPKIAKYIAIASRIVPGWEVKCWKAIDRDLWKMAVEYTDNVNSLEFLKRRFDLRWRTVKELEAMAVQKGLSLVDRDKLSLMEAIIANSEGRRAIPHTPDLFTSETPDFGAITHLIHCYGIQSAVFTNKRILDRESLCNIIPILLVLNAEVNKTSPIINLHRDSAELMFGLTAFVGVDIIAPIVGEYAGTVMKMSYLEPHLQLDRIITSIDDMDRLYCLLQVGEDDILSSTILAHLVIYRGFRFLESFVSKYGDLKTKGRLIGDLQLVLNGYNGLWSNIEDPKYGYNRELTAKYSENIISCLDFLYSRDYISNDTIAAFIGQLGQYVPDKVFHSLQLVSASLNLPDRNLNEINRVIHEKNTDRCIERIEMD